MRAFALLSCLVLSLSASSLCAAPASELKILATDPAPDALMARNQPFFVRFEVKAPSPVTVSASGWFKGKPVIENGGTGAAARLPVTATGVVSFFYWGELPTKIDAVHLQIADQASGALINEYAFPVALTWLADEPPARELPQWVKDWQRETSPRAKSNEPREASALSGDTLMWIAGALTAAIAAGVLFLFYRRRKNSRAGDDRQGR